jgi:hypothetical protein
MNQLIRDAVARRRQPRDAQGRFVSNDEQERVEQLYEIRDHADRHGDRKWVADVDRRLADIDPELVPPAVGIDGGAGRGQRIDLPRDPTARMNALMRAGIRQKRERLAELVDEELRD